MTITKTQKDKRLVLSVEGKLDVNTSLRLQEALIPAFDEAKEIELDFTGLTYISSAGLRVLLMGHKTAAAKGGAMTITSVSQEIMEVFEMTALDNVLTIKP